MNFQAQSNYQIWQNKDLAHTYLSGVRSAIPLAKEQIDCLLRIINLTQIKVSNFLDLGCGNGILSQAIWQQYPQATGVLLDFSEAMLQEAKTNLNSKVYHGIFIKQDFGLTHWTDAIKQLSPFDVIVSGFAIHHQPDERKKQIYQEIYHILKPGGVFLNLEHVISQSNFGEEAFNELFIEHLYAYHQQQNSTQSKEEIAQQYYHRPDKQANILASVENQCNWLREIGFIEVDCFFKIFELALFGGVKAKK
ncbi:Methyltransferase type 11 [Stanieria cyanosphaera PCC 7437]|uniref:Methyltransferase type 11 n=1 Tax=Stanieria cyanosphaera (strain ATCC 29371 / PCC 7437) TaxID=111780 RepID=K9Y105_STAC7|nr:class I SAM-dependent methyltransferase [Stanieria cyanosphaera]AFZ37617.1 Methyltransferase type 11 [Stanieria cyanosphaera PCC 7437]